jgi:hypothetical protein
LKNSGYCGYYGYSKKIKIRNRLIDIDFNIGGVVPTLVPIGNPDLNQAVILDIGVEVGYLGDKGGLQQHHFRLKRGQGRGTKTERRSEASARKWASCRLRASP